mmetsp:Transcript_70933/g.211494  ORF Transcript_70933/g.211494 Transcript_70933/m.211494 type:complete len:254 (-) Transcript_70933:460-1221(-)
MPATLNSGEHQLRPGSAARSCCFNHSETLQRRHSTFRVGMLASCETAALRLSMSFSKRPNRSPCCARLDAVISSGPRSRELWSSSMAAWTLSSSSSSTRVASLFASASSRAAASCQVADAWATSCSAVARAAVICMSSARPTAPRRSSTAASCRLVSAVTSLLRASALAWTPAAVSARSLSASLSRRAPSAAHSAACSASRVLRACRSCSSWPCDSKAAASKSPRSRDTLLSAKARAPPARASAAASARAASA